MGHRGLPLEQASFADCGYFENPAGAEFAPASSPVVAAPPLLINSQLAQVGLLPAAHPASLKRLSFDRTYFQLLLNSNTCCIVHIKC